MTQEDALLRLVPEDYSRTRDYHEFGGGYSLRHAQEDFSVAWRFLDVHLHGACVARVAGIEQRPEELQLDQFSPGRPVQLRLDPEEVDVVGVWDEAGVVRVGDIARQNLYDARQLLFAGEPIQAIVLWDWRTDAGVRKGLNLLIAREGVVADLDVPARRYERPPRRRHLSTLPVAAIAAVVWVVLASLFDVVGAIIGGVIALLAILGTLEGRSKPERD